MYRKVIQLFIHMCVYIYIYTYCFLNILFRYGLSMGIESSSLCYIVRLPGWLGG